MNEYVRVDDKMIIFTNDDLNLIEDSLKKFRTKYHSKHDIAVLLMKINNVRKLQTIAAS